MKKAPIWQFHKELCPEGQVISSQEELDALGPGWVDSPTEFDQKPLAPVLETGEKPKRTRSKRAY